jgi:hypothetical protein
MKLNGSYMLVVVGETEEANEEWSEAERLCCVYYHMMLHLSVLYDLHFPSLKHQSQRL